MPRSLAAFLFALTTWSAAGLAHADRYKAGGVDGYQRPAMAARKHFLPGTQVRARTIGISRDGTRALVVAEAKDKATGDQQLWHLEVDRQSGRVTTALKGSDYSGAFQAQASEENRRNDGTPTSFISVRGYDVTGNGLARVTSSGKHLRIGVPANGKTPARNVLYPTVDLFTGEGPGLKHGHTGGNIVEDPADGVSVKQVVDNSPWYLPHRPGAPNAKPAAK